MGKGQVTDGIYSKGMEHLKIAAELDPDNGEVASALPVRFTVFFVVLLSEYVEPNPLFLAVGWAGLLP